jgi:Leucine-rich repeat (LRR) protein
MKLKPFLLIINLFCLFSIFGQTEVQQIKLSELPIFTSLKEALKDPEQVYKLKLKGLKLDSLPNEIFLLTNLRELTINNCKLQILNANISQFSHLLYLNVSKNRLVRIPEQLFDLKNLKILIISRNGIDRLPENIGNATQLEMIDAWDNPLYVLPESINNLKNSLKMIDLRQIPLKATEYEVMERLLPDTKILITSFCPCQNTR